MKKQLINLFKILLGNACMAFAVNTLILEHGIICGGVSGIGSAVEHYLGISVSLMVVILNVVLFFLSWNDILLLVMIINKGVLWVSLNVVYVVLFMMN